MAVTLTPLLVVDLAVGKVGQVGVKSALEVVVMMAVAAVETATVAAAAAVAAAEVAAAAGALAFHVAVRHSNCECGATQKPMSTLALVLVMVLAMVRSMPRTAIETTATAATTRWIAGVVCSPLLLLLLLGSPLVLLGMGVARGGEGWL
jgi:hypothetical protein